ncbi:MAG: heme o synthase [Dehalococcoidia bacterium]|nr:heme o synthase [Dehalococcoidia bacterium]
MLPLRAPSSGRRHWHRPSLPRTKAELPYDRQLHSARPARAAGYAPELHRADEAADYRPAPRHHGPRNGRRRRTAGHPRGSSIATLVGGTLSAGGANVLNCWYDRDIDGVMSRTQSRPLVRGAIEPGHAFAFGVLLGVAAFTLLWWAATPAAAILSLAALLFYVFIYTIWLKRRTPQNIVIGGAAGAFPPLVGWAAVTGDVAWAGILMFAIIFFWTPPHFWALALKLKDDYAGAGVPMLPVTHGPEETRRQILLYSYVLTGIALALAPVAGLGVLYVAVAVAAGAWFIYLAHELHGNPDTISPMRLYKFSLLYTAVIFVAMGVDVAVRF